jgi:hypothetical protein
MALLRAYPGVRESQFSWLASMALWSRETVGCGPCTQLLVDLTIHPMKRNNDRDQHLPAFVTVLGKQAVFISQNR